MRQKAEHIVWFSV